MAYFAGSVAKLIEQFQKLPGIGGKSAQRLAFHVVSLSEAEAKELSQCILDVKNSVLHCQVCCNISDSEVCGVCSDSRRENNIICVVEDPRDVMAFEKTREYRGLYHVLYGVISPINGISPEHLKIKELLTRINNDKIDEVIMATNPTVEGEATAMYISRLIKPLGVKVTRLAYGIPVGADLLHADEVTLMRAIEGRREF